MTTDGFLDQFGGELGKKFMKKRFRELIAYIAPLPITEQKAALENAFEQWKGNRKQVDDILVIAIRIP
jgi:serine phosphatase RsbU (regulator of sigma subunit)